MSQPHCGEPLGLAGAAVHTDGDVNLGTVSLNVKEEATATISFPGALPSGTTEITLDFKTTTGEGGSDSVTIRLQSRSVRGSGHIVVLQVQSTNVRGVATLIGSTSPAARGMGARV